MRNCTGHWAIWLPWLIRMAWKTISDLPTFWKALCRSAFGTFNFLLYWESSVGATGNVIERWAFSLLLFLLEPLFEFYVLLEKFKSEVLKIWIVFFFWICEDQVGINWIVQAKMKWFSGIIDRDFTCREVDFWGCFGWFPFPFRYLLERFSVFGEGEIA